MASFGSAAVDVDVAISSQNSPEAVSKSSLMGYSYPTGTDPSTVGAVENNAIESSDDTKKVTLPLMEGGAEGGAASLNEVVSISAEKGKYFSLVECSDIAVGDSVPACCRCILPLTEYIVVTEGNMQWHAKCFATAMCPEEDDITARDPSRGLLGSTDYDNHSETDPFDNHSGGDDDEEKENPKSSGYRQLKSMESMSYSHSFNEDMDEGIEVETAGEEASVWSLEDAISWAVTAEVSRSIQVNQQRQHQRQKEEFNTSIYPDAAVIEDLFRAHSDLCELVTSDDKTALPPPPVGTTAVTGGSSSSSSNINTADIVCRISNEGEASVADAIPTNDRNEGHAEKVKGDNLEDSNHLNSHSPSPNSDNNDDLLGTLIDELHALGQFEHNYCPIGGSGAAVGTSAAAERAGDEWVNRVGNAVDQSMSVFPRGMFSSEEKHLGGTLSCPVTCTTHAAMVMHCIRLKFGITMKEYASSFGRGEIEGGDKGEGKSGKRMWFTKDRRFVIKVISNQGIVLQFHLSCLL